MVEYEIKISTPSKELPITVLDSSYKLVGYGKGSYAQHFESGLYKIRAGTQSCLIDLTESDVSVEVDDIGFIIRYGDREERRNFPEIKPLTSEDVVVMEPNGVYDSEHGGWIIRLIMPDGSYSKNYHASYGIRSITLEKKKVEVKDGKMFPHLTKKRYEI